MVWNYWNKYFHNKIKQWEWLVEMHHEYRYDASNSRYDSICKYVQDYKLIDNEISMHWLKD